MIIPVRNGAQTIDAQLAALAQQSYGGPWEVVVADNGSTDATREICRAWAYRLPNLRVVDASQRAGSSYARNLGARTAKGDFLAFCDADDIVSPEWLTALTRDALSCDAITGPQSVDRINPPWVRALRPQRRQRLIPVGGFLPFAPSCNLGVWADVWKELGGFSEEYPQAHDVEWSWRAQLHSFVLAFSPDAVVHYRYRSDLRGIWRQAVASGVDTVRLYRDFRGSGYRRATSKTVAATWFRIVVGMPVYLLSPERRGIWVRRVGEASGRAIGSVEFRLFCL